MYCKLNVQVLKAALVKYICLVNIFTFHQCLSRVKMLVDSTFVIYGSGVVLSVWFQYDQVLQRPVMALSKLHQRDYSVFCIVIIRISSNSIAIKAKTNVTFRTMYTTILCVYGVSSI